jgi:hypothetical protein
MRKTVAAVVLSLLGCSPEELEAMRNPPAAQVNELSHTVDVRFERGAALLTVNRRLRNDSAEYQSLTHRIELPTGAIATALRVGANGQWQSPQLLSTDEALNRWSELTGPGDAAPSTLGMLEWSNETGLDLQLFGLAPLQIVDVQYDLELAPGWEDGEWSFEYPLADWQAAPEFHFARAPSATVTAVRSEAIREANDGRAAAAEPSHVIELGGEVTGYRVHQPGPSVEHVSARWATYPLAAERAMWRFELDAAKVLEPAPVKPNVVFVVDASHSEGADGIASQLEVINGYLANTPDASVEVVVFRRFAERLFGQFVPAAQVAQRLAAARVAPGNGSNLELGAKLAAEALRSAGGVGRIVVFTDEELRDGFENKAAIDALSMAPSGTVVHLVGRTGGTSGELSESREDAAALAEVAAASGGIFLRVSGHPTEPDVARDVTLGLVRPIRIDGFHVEAEGLETGSLDVPGELLEGATLRLSSVAERAPDAVTLTGKIWARDFKRVVSTDFNLADRMPGLAIGDDAIRSQLSEDEIRTAANAARAVSPYTSYFSAPNNAAASTIGVLEAGDLYGYGIGTCGCMGSSSSGCGIGYGTGARLDYEGALRELLRPGVAECSARLGAFDRLDVHLEATGDEVVAVTVDGPRALADCVTEAAWAIRLTSIFVPHRSYRVQLAAEFGK